MPGGYRHSIIIVTAIVCGVFFARRNPCLGRSDRHNAAQLAFGLIIGAVWFFALIRFGLITAFLVGSVFAVGGAHAPIALRSAWYAPYGYLVLAIYAVIALYAFRYSIGGRPLLAPSRLED
jgi:hypothetical protein